MQFLKEPALSKDQAADVVARHAAGETIAALAAAYQVKPTAIQYQVNKAATKTTARGPGRPRTSSAAPDMAAIMADPVMQNLIAQAVADRLANMATPQASGAAAPSGPNAEFATMMTRMFEVLSMQQPGYRKPLSPDEVERRLAGKIEMDALLQRHRRDWERDPSTPLPKWRVGEKGFFECMNAIELKEGDVFETWLPPVEDFMPLNTAANAIHAAMMQQLGGATPDIGEQIKNATVEANRPIVVPGAMQAAAPRGPLRIIERATESTEPPPRKRQLGTIVDEPREVAGGRTSDPVGPTYQAA